MKVYSAVIERCPQTGLFVGFVPGFPGAHTQGETLDEVNHNLRNNRGQTTVFLVNINVRQEKRGLSPITP